MLFLKKIGTQTLENNHFHEHIAFFRQVNGEKQMMSFSGLPDFLEDGHSKKITGKVHEPIFKLG